MHALTRLKELSNVVIVEGVDAESTLPNTLALIAKEKGSDFYLQKLDIEGILVSGGSACRSGVTKASHVMTALGYDEKNAGGLMRVSFGAMTQKEDIDRFFDVMKSVEGS